MARPRSKIDVANVEICARAMMSQADAAMLLGVSLATLKRRIADDDDPVAVAWNRGQAEARQQLRAVQWTMALGGKYTIPGTDQEIVMQPDKGMAIWLGKQYLGQSDKPKTPLASDALPFERFTVKIAHPKGLRLGENGPQSEQPAPGRDGDREPDSAH